MKRKRYAMRKGHSRRSFRHGATRIKRKNTARVMRGGFRI